MRSSSSSPLVTGAAIGPYRRGDLPALREDGDVDGALARAVELAEEDSLIGAERQLPVAERNQHLRSNEGRANVRWAVRSVLVVVPPRPFVVDDVFEGTLD